MPCRQTVVRWTLYNEDFFNEYAQAREHGYDVLGELALKEATGVVDPTDVQKARLAWDARRWHLSKMLPRKYGDKLDLKSQAEISGPNGGPLQLDVLLNSTNLQKLNDTELESLRLITNKIAVPSNADSGDVVEADFTDVPSEADSVT